MEAHFASLRTDLGDDALVRLDIAPNVEKPGRFDPYIGFTAAVRAQTPIRRSMRMFAPEHLCNGMLAMPLVASPGSPYPRGGADELRTAVERCSGAVSGFTADVAAALRRRLAASDELRDTLTAANAGGAAGGDRLSHRTAFAGVFVGHWPTVRQGMVPVPYLVVQGLDAEAGYAFYDDHLEDAADDATWADTFGAGGPWKELYAAAGRQRRAVAKAALNALGFEALGHMPVVETVTNMAVADETGDIFHYHSNTVPLHVRSNGVLRGDGDVGVRLISARGARWGAHEGAWTPPPLAPDRPLPAAPYWDARRDVVYDAAHNISSVHVDDIYLMPLCIFQPGSGGVE